MNDFANTLFCPGTINKAAPQQANTQLQCGATTQQQQYGGASLKPPAVGLGTQNSFQQNRQMGTWNTSSQKNSGMTQQQHYEINALTTFQKQYVHTAFQQNRQMGTWSTSSQKNSGMAQQQQTVSKQRIKRRKTMLFHSRNLII
jgi:hypothetical protein